MTSSSTEFNSEREAERAAELLAVRFYEEVQTALANTLLLSDFELLMTEIGWPEYTDHVPLAELICYLMDRLNQYAPLLIAVHTNPESSSQLQPLLAGYAESTKKKVIKRLGEITVIPGGWDEGKVTLFMERAKDWFWNCKDPAVKSRFVFMKNELDGAVLDYRKSQTAASDSEELQAALRALGL